MAKNKLPRVSFDSCCLIGLIQGESEYSPLITYLDAIDSGKVQCVLSTMVKVEVYKPQTTQLGIRISDLLDSPKIEWIDLGTLVADKAAELRNIYKLKGQDAVQLAGALIGKSDIFFSYDNGYSYGQLENLEISKPKPFGQPHLYETTVNSSF